MNVLNELETWVAHAEDDFEAASALLDRKRPLTYSVCFHSQQCAEKYMKALLVFKSRKFPFSHDLNVLNALCKSAEIDVGVEKKWLTLLSAYAIAARYSSDVSSIEDAKEALEIATEIRKFARMFLGLGK